MNQTLKTVILIAAQVILKIIIEEVYKNENSDNY